MALLAKFRVLSRNASTPIPTLLSLYSELPSEVIQDATHILVDCGPQGGRLAGRVEALLLHHSRPFSPREWSIILRVLTRDHTHMAFQSAWNRMEKERLLAAPTSPHAWGLPSLLHARITSLGRAGCPREAEAAYATFATANPAFKGNSSIFTALARLWIEHGDMDKALAVIHRARASGITIARNGHLAILKGYFSHLRTRDAEAYFHGLITEAGLDKDPKVWRIILKGYLYKNMILTRKARQRSLPNTSSLHRIRRISEQIRLRMQRHGIPLFDHSHDPSFPPLGPEDAALARQYAELRGSSATSPTPWLYISALTSAIRVQDWERAKEYYDRAYALCHRTDSDRDTPSSPLHANPTALSNDTRKKWDVEDRQTRQVLGNVLLGGYTRHGEWEMAEAFLTELKVSHFTPDAITYESIARMRDHHRDPEWLLSSLAAEGIPPLQRTFTYLSSRREGPVNVVALLAEMDRLGIRIPATVYTRLIYHLGRAGMLEDAEDLYIRALAQGLQPPIDLLRGLLFAHVNALSYTEDLGSSAMRGPWKVIGEMRRYCGGPGPWDWELLAAGFSRIGDVRGMEQALAEAAKDSSFLSLHAHTTRIAGYARAKRPEEAEDILRHLLREDRLSPQDNTDADADAEGPLLREPVDAATWSAVVWGYVFIGAWGDVWRLRAEMANLGIRLHGSLLHAFSRATAAAYGADYRAQKREDAFSGTDEAYAGGGGLFGGLGAGMGEATDLTDGWDADDADLPGRAAFPTSPSSPMTPGQERRLRQEREKRAREREEGLARTRTSLLLEGLKGGMSMADTMALARLAPDGAPEGETHPTENETIGIGAYALITDGLGREGDWEALLRVWSRASREYPAPSWPALEWRGIREREALGVTVGWGLVSLLRLGRKEEAVRLWADARHYPWSGRVQSLLAEHAPSTMEEGV